MCRHDRSPAVVPSAGGAEDLLWSKNSALRGRTLQQPYGIQSHRRFVSELLNFKCYFCSFSNITTLRKIICRFGDPARLLQCELISRRKVRKMVLVAASSLVAVSFFSGHH